MKEFVIYTGLRIVLFFGSLGIVFGVWDLVADSVPLVWCIVIAFVVSGIGSYFLLHRQRSAFAARVEARAERATAAFEERRAREDAE